MVLASPGMVPLPALIFGTIGIALASGSAAAFNHVLDRRIDEHMARTRAAAAAHGHTCRRARPSRSRASSGFASMLMLWPTVGELTAAADLLLADRLRHRLHAVAEARDAAEHRDRRRRRRRAARCSAGPPSPTPSIRTRCCCS